MDMTLPPALSEADTLDVLIVGAGISGIGAAHHLQHHCPQQRFAIVEARDDLGGTWDLFRYPGIRSDSDMYTLGYSFRPWDDPKSIADGPTIMRYLRDTAAQAGIDRLIRFGLRVVRADWSSAEALWTVTLRRGADGGQQRLQCRFLFMCCGYYRYDQGYTPDFPGREAFKGTIVHPQLWPEGLDHAGKRVVVIGSGATAVTLVPAMAETAVHVTMLQRSPTYVIARPSVDAVAQWLRRRLPARQASALVRWKNLLLGMYIFRVCRRKPEKARAFFIGEVRKALGPDFDVERHFAPAYRPWEQRLCLVPDGDLFKALRSGRASVVTDHVERFTAEGIALKSGAMLPADIIVTATGLSLQMMGGAELHVDGERIDPAQCLNYRGLMFCGIPNLAATFGYTNASWTLKADLTSLFVCRLLDHMRKTGSRQCVPRPAGPEVERQPWVDFSSGYFQRALDVLPRQGSQAPWKLNQNYLADIAALRFGAVDDGVLRFAP